MNLHLILPVADTPATRAANTGIPLALSVLQKSTHVTIHYMQSGFESLDTLTRIAYNTPEIIETARKAQAEGSDGIFINCFADPAVDIVREITEVPVFGAFRTSMLTALGCGKKISIIIPGKEDPYGKRILTRVIENNPEFTTSIVHQGFTNLDVLELKDSRQLLKRLTEFALESEEHYGCECMVLGCTAMSYIIEDLRTELHRQNCRISVVEPLSSGLKMLETFVQLNLHNHYGSTDRNSMDHFIHSP